DVKILGVAKDAGVVAEGVSAADHELDLGLVQPRQRFAVKTISPFAQAFFNRRGLHTCLKSARSDARPGMHRKEVRNIMSKICAARYGLCHCSICHYSIVRGEWPRCCRLR